MVSISGWLAFAGLVLDLFGDWWVILMNAPPSHKKRKKLVRSLNCPFLVRHVFPATAATAAPGSSIEIYIPLMVSGLSMRLCKFEEAGLGACARADKSLV